MKVLALDPGQKIVGYALVETLSETCPTLNVTATGKFDGSNERKVSKQLEKLFNLHNPDFVGYELTGNFLNSFYNKVVQEACKKRGIPALGCRVPDIRHDVYSDAHMSKRESNHILKESLFNLPSNVSKHELDAISVGFFITNLQTKSKKKPGIEENFEVDDVSEDA